MSKTGPTPAAISPATLAANAPAVVAHTLVRLRGEQTGDINVYNARSPLARVVVRFGSIAMTFWNAAAAQGVLEGVAAARTALLSMPVAMPVTPDPYGQPAVAVEWTHRPNYAVIPQSRMSDAHRRTLAWFDLHMGPITWQVLDRTAYHSLAAVLAEVHRTAVAVCLDGPDHSADPTSDDYTPPTR